MINVVQEKVTYEFKGLFRVIEAKLNIPLFSGEMSAEITRINFDRGQSVSVLLYDSVKDSVVLIRQFRYPVYSSLNKSREKYEDKNAWMLETVAGIKRPDEDVNPSIVREVLEETGYHFNADLDHITTMFPSPGGSSEKISVFLGEVNSSKFTKKVAGVSDEDEETEVVKLSFDRAMAMIKDGEICDAKTIIALQYLALRKLENNK